MLLRVAACGINFADTLMVAGRYQEKPALPFAPGLEVAGTVVAVGPGAALAPGTRVVALTPAGGLAEYVAVAAERCTPVPDTMTDEIAAGFPIAYGTSHVALAWLARLRPGETLLVTGAAGGVGLTAVETRRAARRPGRRRRPRRARSAPWPPPPARPTRSMPTTTSRAALRALGGVDVVYDTVGGAGLRRGLARHPPRRAAPADRLRRRRRSRRSRRTCSS